MPIVTVWPRPSGVADGEHVVADAHAIGVTQRDGLQVAGRLVEAHDGYVRRRVAARTRARTSRFVRQL